VSVNYKDQLLRVAIRLQAEGDDAMGNALHLLEAAEQLVLASAGWTDEECRTALARLRAECPDLFPEDLN
jgi:hypothetical protein